MANQVLANWALSEDENLRFVALSLIEDFKISDATPAVQTLASRHDRAAPLARLTSCRRSGELLEDLRDGPGKNLLLIPSCGILATIKCSPRVGSSVPLRDGQMKPICFGLPHLSD